MALVGIRGDHASSDGHYHNFIVEISDAALYRDKRRLSTQVLAKWAGLCPAGGAKVAKELHEL